MSTDRLVEGLAEKLDRRSFITRAGMATVGGLLALMGLPGTANANAPDVSYKCCNLCGSPQSCGSCWCQWCWTCCNTADNTKWECCECYESPNSQCNGSCPAPCSSARQVGSC